MRSVDEAAAELEAQIITAAGLGFGLVRLHAGIPVDALERVASSAERSDVVVATEVQGGQAPDDPVVEVILECRERSGSVIGLVLDFSVSMTAVPASFADADEGWHWDTEGDAFEMAARQQALCRQMLQDLETAGVEGGSA